MKINASITANYFLKKAKEEKTPISLMKLLKLVYIAHGWTLAMLNKRALDDDEKVEAWKFGPVITSLYHEFKHFGNNPIEDWSQTTTEQTDDSFELKTIFLEKEAIADKEQLLEINKAVWESYKEYSAWGLSQITHETDTPWKQTYQEGKKSLPIPDELTKDYYRNYLKKIANANE
jgi:uncharacterized phage-associated protein